MKEFVIWYKSFENKVHRQDLYEKYYFGQSVEWTGIIDNVSPGTMGSEKVFLSLFEEGAFVMALFDGEKVTVSGKLSEITSIHKDLPEVIILDEPQLLNVKPR